jgi:hypothetical protein
VSTTKTHPTAASIDDYIASRATDAQRADCAVLMALLHKVTGEEPKMWGPSIVGYGAYQYTYDSGHAGEACLTGFAIRGREFVVYLMASAPEQAGLLAALGKHRMGKACLYFKRVSDLDLAVLETLVATSVAELRTRSVGR